MNGQATGAEVLAGLEQEMQDAESIDVYCWRMEQLLSAGYKHVIADALAADPRVDLHLACDLVAGGCSHDLAYRIVS
jgi:GrpB-like predicted nucleotidyltransferase (UPF0157 family)